MVFVIKGSRNASVSQETKRLPTRLEIEVDTRQHINDVKQLFYYFMRKEVYPDVNSHDWTKIHYIDDFLENFRLKVEEGKPFKEQYWWKLHITEEPHHAFDYQGNQLIHLGHIIHMLCDWMAAGKSRSKDGQYHNLKIPDDKVKELLFKAWKNTLLWLDKETKVIGTGLGETE
jgi:hypothetical protein